ncbi:MAG: DUF4364 family protein [Lachnospiraceae bacterium]|nr:DUF4364 family protein [Lachnospiraceae bacterium]
MSLEPLTLYKLMTLYMLNKVNFPLTTNQLLDFFLSNNYTNYFTYMQILSELEESKLVNIEVVRSNSYYKINDDGAETIDLFVKKIPVSIIDDMDIFLVENKYELRNEVSALSDYYKSTNQDYIINCRIIEGNSTLIDMNLSVPSEDVAEMMCDNWRSSSQEIYSSIMKTLMKE